MDVKTGDRVLYAKYAAPKSRSMTRSCSSSKRATFSPSLRSKGDKHGKATCIHDGSTASLEARRRYSRQRRSNDIRPKGRNVALDKKYGAPTVTHDGVTVARKSS